MRVRTPTCKKLVCSYTPVCILQLNIRAQDAGEQEGNMVELESITGALREKYAHHFSP